MAERRRETQIELFPTTTRAERHGAAVDPAPVGADVATLADRLPAGLRLGTSSWSFPGWTGIVDGGRVTGQRLA